MSQKPPTCDGCARRMPDVKLIRRKSGPFSYDPVPARLCAKCREANPGHKVVEEGHTT